MNLFDEEEMFKRLDQLDKEMDHFKKEKKQLFCKHDFEEIDRSEYDEDGQRYFDENGYWQTVESVTFRCKNFDLIKYEMDHSDGAY